MPGLRLDCAKGQQGKAAMTVQGRQVLAGDPQIDIVLRRSARARRMSLTVSGLDGRVTLTLPKRVALREGMAFVREKEAWLRGQLDRRPDPAVPAAGSGIEGSGRARLIVTAECRRARLLEDRIEVPRGASVPAQVASCLKAEARARLTEASTRHAAILGRPFGRITLRDTRSRWGSCSSQGDLMYSWRLILAPAAVLDYVAAHEVAHLERMDHSPAFWAVVARLMPDHAAPRDWLRRNGAELHRWSFTA